MGKWLVASLVAIGLAGMFVMHREGVRKKAERARMEKEMEIKKERAAREVELAAKLRVDQAIAARLRLAAKDPEPQIRWEAVDSLYRGGAPDAVSLFASMALADTDVGNRRQAMARLADIGNPQAVATLLKLLRDSKSDIRIEALHALARAGDESTVPRLTEMASDPKMEVRVEAVRALGQMRARLAGMDAKVGQAIAARLRLAAKDPEPQIRWEAVDSLYRGGAPDAVSLFASVALADADIGNRRQAMARLADIGNPQAVATLLKLLRDSKSDIRIEALHALARAGDESTVPRLTEMASDPKMQVRVEAVRALDQMRARLAEMDAKKAAELRAKEALLEPSPR